MNVLSMILMLMEIAAISIACSFVYRARPVYFRKITRRKYHDDGFYGFVSKIIAYLLCAIILSIGVKLLIPSSSDTIGLRRSGVGALLHGDNVKISAVAITKNARNDNDEFVDLATVYGDKAIDVTQGDAFQIRTLVEFAGTGLDGRSVTETSCNAYSDKVRLFVSSSAFKPQDSGVYPATFSEADPSSHKPTCYLSHSYSFTANQTGMHSIVIQASLPYTSFAPAQDRNSIRLPFRVNSKLSTGDISAAAGSAVLLLQIVFGKIKGGRRKEDCDSSRRAYDDEEYLTLS